MYNQPQHITHTPAHKGTYTQILNVNQIFNDLSALHASLVGVPTAPTLIM